MNKDENYITTDEMTYKALCKEIDRLNNIISELEKWLIEYRTFIDIPDYYEEGIIDCIDDTLNKLKELKEKE